MVAGGGESVERAPAGRRALGERNRGKLEGLVLGAAAGKGADLVNIGEKKYHHNLSATLLILEGAAALAFSDNRRWHTLCNMPVRRRVVVSVRFLLCFGRRVP